MKTIHIIRGKEKYYAENKIKVFINDNFVGELKQKESKEIQVPTEIIEVYAKALFYKSPTEIIHSEEISEIEVIMNPSIKTNPILLLPLIPMYFLIMYQLKNEYLKIAASILFLLLLIGLIIQTRRAMKKGIIISKK